MFKIYLADSEFRKLIKLRINNKTSKKCQQIQPDQEKQNQQAVASSAVGIL